MDYPIDLKHSAVLPIFLRLPILADSGGLRQFLVPKKHKIVSNRNSDRNLREFDFHRNFRPLMYGNRYDGVTV